MKSFLLALVSFIVLTASTSAQIQNLPVLNDTTVNADLVYAGILTGTNFSLDSLSQSTSASVVLGFKMSYKPADWISFHAIEGVCVDNQAPISGTTRFWGKLSFGAISLEAGYRGTLATETRPLFVTADGQFESWTTRNIPGGALGALVRYSFSGYSIGAGIAQRKGLPEYHARFTSSDVQLTLYYPKVTDKFGAALSWQWGDVSNTSVYNVDQVAANVISFPLDKEQKLDFYLDAGYSFKENKLVRTELGLTKGFTAGLLKGFIGLAYNHESSGITGYLYVHL